LSPQLLADIMHIACSDSIDAWADIIVFTQTEDPAMYKMEIIELAEEEENNHHTITGSTILLGMQRIIDLELPPPIPNNEITTTSQIQGVDHHVYLRRRRDDDRCVLRRRHHPVCPLQRAGV
jgi:hypothetical protein